MCIYTYIREDSSDGTDSFRQVKTKFQQTTEHQTKVDREGSLWEEL